MASFGWTGPTGQEDHFQKWTTLTGKFLHKSKHSIKFYFSTEISENVGIMKSTPSFSCPKEGLVVTSKGGVALLRMLRRFSNQSLTSSLLLRNDLP